MFSYFWTVPWGNVDPVANYINRKQETSHAEPEAILFNIMPYE